MPYVSAMDLTFHPLSSIPAAELVALLNDRDVRRHMPLDGGTWTEAAARDWSVAKDAQWQLNGFGPWAIRIGGAFAGWGGFQKEGAEADLGLVLLPRYWGSGRAVFAELMRRGAEELSLPPITILLPPSRVRLRSLERLGFARAGVIDYAGKSFIKFVFANPSSG